MQKLQPSRPNDISTGVAGLLLTVWGVWGAARSYFFLPQSLQAGSCLTLVLKHVRSNHKLCFWLCQSWFQGGVNWIICWFLIKKLSLSLPPQLSNWHQGGDLKVSQPREAQGISGSSVYRKGDAPEHRERGPHFPGCTCRACRQGSNVSLRADTTPFPLCLGAVYSGSWQAAWKPLPDGQSWGGS